MTQKGDESLYTELVENAVTIPDDATKRLCQAASEARINVAMGLSERNREASNASLYNTLLYIDDSGNILGEHRKLVMNSRSSTLKERSGSTPGTVAL